MLYMILADIIILRCHITHKKLVDLLQKTDLIDCDC